MWCRWAKSRISIPTPPRGERLCARSLSSDSDGMNTVDMGWGMIESSGKRCSDFRALQNFASTQAETGNTMIDLKTIGRVSDSPWSRIIVWRPRQAVNLGIINNLLDIVREHPVVHA